MTMMSAAEAFIEFVKQPDDGSRLELAQDEYVFFPALNPLQKACCEKFAKALGRYKDLHGGRIRKRAAVVTARNPDTVRIPDLVYFQVSPPRFASPPPELVVEMILPTALHSAVYGRVRQYLAAGVRLVWIADPESRICTVYRGPTKTTSILCETDTLSGEDVLPGFSCRVADLFA
jgi:Uma2 family endonuclease